MSKQRLSANITIGGVLEKSFRKNIGLIRSGFESVGDSIKDVKARQKELSRQREDLKKQGRSVEALDREYEDLERTLGDLTRKQERWTSAMRASNRVGSDFSRMTSTVGRTVRNFGLAAGAAATGVFAVASSTADLGDTVAKNSRKFGLTVEAYQELRFAAERSGIEIATFDSSMTAFTKRMGEAAQGTGEARNALEALGLNIKDIKNLSPEEQLKLIADRMKGIESPAERAAIASDLFSRAGVGMVNMLGDGSGAMEDLFKRARELGFVLGEDAARNSEKFKDAQLDAQLAVIGLKNTVGAEFLPVVTDAMVQFSNWAVTNREDIVGFARAGAEKLREFVPVVTSVAQGMGEVAGTVGQVVSNVADMVGGWENFGVVIGTVLAGRAISSIFRFGGSVFRLGRALVAVSGATPLVVGGIKAIGRAMLLNPIGLAITAIAGGAALIIKNWDKVGPWAKDLWGGVKKTFSGFGDFVGGVWRGDMDAAADGLGKAWEGGKETLGTVLKGVGGVFKATWENLIRPVTDKMGVTDEIESAWSSASDFLGRTVGSIGSFFTDAWANHVEPFMKDFSATDGLVTAWQTIQDGIGEVLDWLAEKFQWLMGKIQPVIDLLKWTVEKAGQVGDAVRDVLPDFSEARRRDAPVLPGPPRDTARRPQSNYLGGVFGRQPIRVGEQGEETIWPTQGGYVATAGATQRLAAAIDRVRPVLDGAGLQSALERGSRAAAGLAAGVAAPLASAAPQLKPASAPAPQQSPPQVIQNITIEALGASAQEVADEIDRRKRAAASGALFDGTHDYGQYGGS